MKPTFLQVGKQQEFPELFQNLLYNYNVTISVITSVDKDVVQIHNDKDIKLLNKDFVDKLMKAYKYVC